MTEISEWGTGLPKNMNSYERDKRTRIESDKLNRRIQSLVSGHCVTSTHLFYMYEQ